MKGVWEDTPRHMRSKQMRLTCIITGLPIGGAEMMLLKLMSRLSSDIRPHVISLTTIGEIGPRLRTIGIPVEALGITHAAIGPVGFGRLVGRLRALKPDVVHTWLYHADLIGGLAARLAGVPAVAWGVHTSDLPTANVKWTTRAVVRACAALSTVLPDRIMCCSEAAVQIHVAMGYPAAKFLVLPNGIDINVFLPSPTARASVRQELGIPGDTVLIGLIGRFDPQKNHEGFIQAAGILHRRAPAVHFLLAGTGVDRNNKGIMRAISQAGIDGVSHLLGARNDIPRLTAALDIASLASGWGEALPNVILEAMACGVPCVVTDVGDSKHVVADTGVVVPRDDPAALTEGWARLLALAMNERRALGERARARVTTQFALDRITAKYEAFYRDLIEQAARDRF